MIHNRFICMAYLLSISAFIYAKTFTQNGIIYETLCDSTVKVIKVYSHEYILIPENVMDGESIYTVAEIDSMAFYFLYRIRQVRLPRTIKRVRKHAFFNCSNLSVIQVLASVPPVCDEEAFVYIPLENCRLYVPEQCVDRYRATVSWGKMKQVRGMLLLE